MSDAESRFRDQCSGRLNGLKGKDRYRSLEVGKGIDFSSNDYLGLANHPHIRKAMVRALEEGIPLGATGSRLLRGHTVWHAALEQSLSAFKQGEPVLIFNSGYDANTGILSCLCGAGDLVFCDSLIHASMIDGIRASKAERVIFAHNDMEQLAAALAQSRPARHRFIVVESLYSMDGDRAPLRELAALAKKFEAMLIVDEAHATGLFGPQGAGLCAAEGVRATVTIHTCGKAWGSFGAFISCNTVIRDYLVNHCRRLIFTTALPPLLAVQWQAVLLVMAQEPWRAQQALAMASRFRQAVAGFCDTGNSDSQIVPLMLGTDRTALNMAESLQAQGFDIRAIRPPTVPRGTARLRIAFNATIEASQVDELAAICRQPQQVGVQA